MSLRDNNPEKTQQPTPEHISQLIECSICLEPSAFPIYNCSNGHITCGVCFVKLDKCGLCHNRELVVSPFAERLARRHDIKKKCENFDKGCLQEQSCSEYKKHSESCEYRDIVCNKSRGWPCGSTVPIQDYAKHLKEIHKVVEIKNGTFEIFTISNECQLIISFEGKPFILNAEEQPAALYFWVTFLGGGQEASDYFFRIEIVNEKSNGGIQPYCIWQLPVLPHHGYSSVLATNKENYASIARRLIGKHFGCERRLKIKLEILKNFSFANSNPFTHSIDLSLLQLALALPKEGFQFTSESSSTLDETSNSSRPAAIRAPKKATRRHPI